ncbi:N,N-dimethylformamidase beta subunit family domain-containing protein [Siminovitchia sediminis]|uniref:N,N-dimethylformamidase beta subunit family domain-containing protein n=1 Tax=Siminovitchia sediminis TaxID=1274353 RepID=A0ABW4KRG9_9BACI
MSRIFITGYCDRPNVAPGESLDFFVNTEIEGEYRAELVRLFHGDLNPDGPGYQEVVIDSNINGTYRGIKQETQIGGYIECSDNNGLLNGKDGLTLQCFIWPTTPEKRQGIISRWSDNSGKGWALLIEDGHLVFVVGDGKNESRVKCPQPLFPEVWYSVVVRLDVANQLVSISQVAKVNSVNSRVGRVAAIESDGQVTEKFTTIPADAGVPVIIAGLSRDSNSNKVVANYNGKIDAPKLYSRPLNDKEVEQLQDGSTVGGAVAAWDFAEGITENGIPTDLVYDVTGSNLHGRCINQPDRGMTGWNWKGREEHFIHAPEEYGAIWFHEDSLDDCRWQKSFSLQIPLDIKSGAYAVKVEKDGHFDHIPFFITPPQDTATAKVAVLIPTLSYMAYANTQVMQNAAVGQAIMGIITTLDDRDLELNERNMYGLSTYDYHVDGRGVQYSTWRRPILNMRPTYRHEFGSVWQFPADLHLIDWFKAINIDCDVITDHDLIRDGAELLSKYKVVVTGSHPEYYTGGMLDAWEEYINTGGRALYLAGNGFYWITTVHPEKPWLIEVRKGESGDQAWRARPGELYHSTTGERGGLWRHRARAPQKIWGTGYGSHGLDVSVGYYPMPDASDHRLEWIFDGVNKEEIIGDFGLVNGGASGLEMDRIDYALGTPPNTMLLACSSGHSANAMLVPEDQYFAYPGLNGKENPLVRADMTYFTSYNGGAVFSASSMAWCGSLSHNNYNNSVSKITENIIRRFCSDQVLEEVL